MSGLSTAGMRSWSSAHNSFGVVVMIAKLRTHSSAGERQFSHRPASAIRLPLGGSVCCVKRPNRMLPIRRSSSYSIAPSPICVLLGRRSLILSSYQNAI